MLTDSDAERQRQRQVRQLLRNGKGGDKDAARDVYRVTSGEAERRARVRAQLRRPPAATHVVLDRDAAAVAAMFDDKEFYADHEDAREVSDVEQRARYFEQRAAEAEEINELAAQMRSQRYEKEQD